MQKDSNPVVGILMGSASDIDVMKISKETLAEFGVNSEIRVLSAHRTPDEAIAWAKSAEDRGFKVVIAAAGMAAHLAGVVAANTNLPVLGVPLDGGMLSGLDSLLSTVQMPKGTPVGTVAVGKSGAINAGLLAVRILAVSDSELRAKLVEYKNNKRDESLAADSKLNQ